MTRKWKYLVSDNGHKITLGLYGAIISQEVVFINNIARFNVTSRGSDGKESPNYLTDRHTSVAEEFLCRAQSALNQHLRKKGLAKTFWRGLGSYNPTKPKAAMEKHWQPMFNQVYRQLHIWFHKLPTRVKISLKTSLPMQDIPDWMVRDFENIRAYREGILKEYFPSSMGLRLDKPNWIELSNMDGDSKRWRKLISSNQVGFAFVARWRNRRLFTRPLGVKELRRAKFLIHTYNHSTTDWIMSKIIYAPTSEVKQACGLLGIPSDLRRREPYIYLSNYLRDAARIDGTFAERMKNRSLLNLGRESARVHHERNLIRDRQNAAIRGKQCVRPDEELLKAFQEAGIKFLSTVGELQDRGAKEGHCVGSLWRATQPESLRQAYFLTFDDKKLGRATAEIDILKNQLVQCYGPRNTKNKAASELEARIQKIISKWTPKQKKEVDIPF